VAVLVPWPAVASLLRFAVALALLTASATAALAAPACSGAASSQGSIDGQERRLLPGIVERQEVRVQEAAQAVQAAEDRASALRLRQRMLIQHGRADLAEALESQAAAVEAELVALRQRLADEQSALDAYRDYATRAGVHVAPLGPAAIATASRGSRREP
jgi:TolA-binding protein